MASDLWLDGFKSHLRDIGLSWPLTLSCNPSGQVWETISFGLSKHEDRDYLEDPAMLELASMVLEVEPRGGRFTLDDDCCLLRKDFSRITWDEIARWVTPRTPKPLTHKQLQRGRRKRARIIAPRSGVQSRIPDAKFHRMSGNIHNPRRGPLSQGGDT